jgi:hypothetical protein
MGPVAAAGVLAAAELAGAAADVLDPAAGDDVAVEAVDDEPELHPAIRSAITATAAPPAAMRARLILSMVFTRLLESKAFGRRVHRGFGWLIDQ